MERKRHSAVDCWPERTQGASQVGLDEDLGPREQGVMRMTREGWGCRGPMMEVLSPCHTTVLTLLYGDWGPLKSSDKGSDMARFISFKLIQTRNPAVIRKLVAKISIWKTPVR